MSTIIKPNLGSVIIKSSLGITTVKAEPTRGLVGFWSMEEGTGKVAHDFSGFGNHGTLVNGPGWVDGIKGKCLSFLASSSQYVSLGVNSSLTPLKFTISLWFYSTVLNGSFALVGLGYNFATKKGLIFRTDSNSKVSLFMDNGVAENLVQSSVFSVNAWNHVVATYDGTTTSIYLNNGTPTTSVMGLSFNLGTFGSYIGRRGDSDSGADASLKIDDVRIYNRALSTAEILAIYNS